MAPGGMNLIPKKVVRKTLSLSLEDVVEHVRSQLHEAGELSADTEVEIRFVLNGKVWTLEQLAASASLRFAWEV